MTATTTTIEQAERLYREADPSYRLGRHRCRVARLARVLLSHPEAVVESCLDERTGCRYGRAACRRGRAEKIGYTTHSVQFWAVW